MSYKVIVWDNAGQRVEYPTRDLAGALAVAKGQRTVANRTVKVGHCGNSIKHWSRSTDTARNHWSVRATADEWFV